MIKKYSIPIILFFLGIFALSLPLAYAQVRSTDIVLSISPQYPKPNQSVTATLGSYVTNLDRAHISWSTNNQEISGGLGRKTFQFSTENSGSPLKLTATINTVDGQNIQKTMTITPADMDILWEAHDSYIPPFYKGKTLSGSQGAFKMVAIPSLTNQGGRVNVNNLSYVWTRDGNIQPDSSGWGKSHFIFNNSYLDRGNTIGVKVTDITGSANASGSVNLTTVQPKIVLYSNDPLLGVRWERAVGNGFRINPDGETLVAEPYFFSPKNINSTNLSFSWFLNNRQTQTPGYKNIISVRPETGQSGNTIIKIMVENTKMLFQEAEKEINVAF